jgi:hypothetical protein
MTFLKISVVLIIQFAIVLVTIGQTPKIEFRFSCKEELNAIGLDYAEMMLINHSDDRIGIGKDVNFCLEAQIASGQWLIFYEANVIPYPPSFYYIQKRDTLFKKIQINILNMVSIYPRLSMYLIEKGGEVNLRAVTYYMGKEKIVSKIQKIKIHPLSEQDLSAYRFLMSIEQKPNLLTDISYFGGYPFNGLSEVIQNFPNSTFAILAKIALVNNERKQPRLKPLKTARKTEMKREIDALKDSPYEFIRNVVKETNDRLEKMETRD